jgi:hypothetical protein
MSPNLEYISNATGIDIREYKKLFTYEYLITFFILKKLYVKVKK